MKKAFFFILIFLVSGYCAFSHNENSTKVNIESSGIIQKWESLADSPDKFAEFGDFLDSCDSEKYQVWEYLDEENRILKELKNAAARKDEKEILALLINQGTLEENIASYKNEKLVTLVTILIIILVVFLCTAIFFAFNFYDSQKREKFTKELNRQIISIQEAEKRKLSHELHDTVAQDLKAISLISESEKIDGIIANTISDIRRLCYNLAPPELECNKLSDAIAIITDNLRKTTDIEIPLAITDPDFINSFNNEKQLNIFRIIQECLENIKVHSHAQEASILIKKENSMAKIIICDDGNGFDPASIEQNSHFGIKNIKERTQSMNGKFELKSDIDFGTEIVITIPGDF